MVTADLTKLDLIEGSLAGDPAAGFHANFALFGGNGAEGASAVYIQLEPGQALGEHTDNLEEGLFGPRR